MRHMKIKDRILPLVILIVDMFCGSQHALGQDFQNLPIPPSNGVFHPVRLPNPPSFSLSPVPPSAHALAVRLLRDGHVPHDTSYTIRGKIDIINQNLITFHPENGAGSDISIGFALLGNMVLKRRQAVNAVLTVNDSSSPFAANQKIRIAEGTNLYACYVWQHNHNPVVVDLPDTVVQIRQQSDGHSVTLKRPGGTIPLKVGRPETVKIGGIPYTIFVQTAILQRPKWKRGGDGTPEEYILKAIVAVNY